MRVASAGNLLVPYLDAMRYDRNVFVGVLLLKVKQYSTTSTTSTSTGILLLKVK